MEYRNLALNVLRGATLTRAQALEVLRSTDDDLLDLLSAAFLLRRERFGRGVLLHVIRNAKSGHCTENCAYCSQSAVSKSEIPRYGMQSVDELLTGAREAYRFGAVRYCIVTAGRGLPLSEIEHVCEATRRIKAELPLSICVSLGVLDDERAMMLKDAGVDRYNHNLETSPRHFATICQTHTFDDRVATAKRAKSAGLELCSGALLGMGESLEDRVELAFALAELQVDAIPVNFLDPRAGTPLEGSTRMSPGEALRVLALFRFVHPKAELRVAGGREKVLGSLQALSLYPANSLFTTGYLTTAGQGFEADVQMIQSTGFHVAGLAE